MILSCSPVYNEPEEFQWSRDDREFQHYEVGQKEKPTSTGGGQPAFQDSGDVTIDVVARDEARLRLVGAIEDFGLLWDEESRGEGGLCAPFFLARP